MPQLDETLLMENLFTFPNIVIFALAVVGIISIIITCVRFLNMSSVLNAWRWVAKNYVWIVIVIGIGLMLAALVLYVHQLPQLIRRSVSALRIAFLETPQDSEKLRNLSYAFAALAGALTIMATIPFQLIRVWLNERAATTAEQSHITDQINRAVEGLGAEKSVKDEDGERTAPNVAVRLGAVYSLERISQDSGRDHIQIMEVLTAYVRENSPSSRAIYYEDEISSNKTSDAAVSNEYIAALKRANASARDASIDPAFYEYPVWIWARNFLVLSDIQAVMRVIGRRNTLQLRIEATDKRYGKVGYVLDLRKSNLQGVDVSQLNFEGARISECFFDGANLSQAILERSDLRWSQFKGTRLIEVCLACANLSEAYFEGADLISAKMDGAKLRDASIIHSDLALASLKGTDFTNASLYGVSLNQVVFDEKTIWNVASMKGSALQGNDFSNRRDVNNSFFAEAFGDGSVKLPEGLVAGQGVLKHWESALLDDREFYARWRAWQKVSGFCGASN